MTFPSDLKSARQSAKLNQAQAATELRIGKRSLQYWEAGKLSPIYPAQHGAIALLREIADRPAKPLVSPTKP